MLKYKFNNGYIFKEDALIAPYLTLGGGVAAFSGKKTNEDGVDGIIPVGIGARLYVFKWMALQYQFLYTFTTGDNRDLEINGHTDDLGKDDMNLDLSQKRADAVKTYLTDKGIQSSRMTAKGFGETIPVFDNNTSDGRALNRRVEFKVVF